MKRALCLLAGLFTLSLVPASAADEATFPAKNPVLKYVLPEKWTSEVDAADGSLSINSDDDDQRISVSFAELPVEATMDGFKELVPEMIKDLKDSKEVQAAKEETSDGLTGFTTGFVGMYEGSQAMMIITQFKVSKERSVIATIVMMDPATMPKEQGPKFEAFTKSLKGIAEK